MLLLFSRHRPCPSVAITIPLMCIHFKSTHSPVSLPGSYRLHCLQRGPQEQLFPALHPPLPAQRVPEGLGGCRGDLPRL